MDLALMYVNPTVIIPDTSQCICGKVCLTLTLVIGVFLFDSAVTFDMIGGSYHPHWCASLLLRPGPPPPALHAHCKGSRCGTGQGQRSRGQVTMETMISALNIHLQSAHTVLATVHHQSTHNHTQHVLSSNDN